MARLGHRAGMLVVALALPAATAAAQDHDAGHGEHGQAGQASMNSGSSLTLQALTDALALSADQQQAITPYLATVNRNMKSLHDALGEDQRMADVDWDTASPELRAAHDSLKASLGQMEALFTDAQLEKWRELHHHDHDPAGHGGDHDAGGHGSGHDNDR